MAIQISTKLLEVMLILSVTYQSSTQLDQVDSCFSDPCLNNAQCIPLPGDYKCLCGRGWQGSRCETRKYFCPTRNFCAHGKCVDIIPTESNKNSLFRCDCDVGWEGRLCTDEIDYCKGRPCQNNGTCLGELGGYQCQCNSGYTGLNCETDGCKNARITAYVSEGQSAVSVHISQHQIADLLPVGQYLFTSTVDGYQCTVEVNVRASNDYYLRRRLEIVANYSVDCSLIADRISQSALRSITNANLKQIGQICQADCKEERSIPVTVSCNSRVLTVSSPTNIVYGAEVTEIPADLHNRLTHRLSGKVSMMNILVIGQSPPVVSPQRNKYGAQADLVLSGFCLNELVYNPATDSCN